MPSDTHSPPDQPLSLETVLNSFIDSDETITYRAVAKELGMAVSSVTRSAQRRALIDAANERQSEMRLWAKRAQKASQKNLLGKLADKERRIDELEQQVALLTASHKAVILAIGETGGYSAWQKFFESYEHIPAMRSLFPPETRG